MKSIFTLITFLIILNGYSQVGLPVRPYEKIQYTGINPVWHETSYDSLWKDGKYLDGYNHYRLSTNITFNSYVTDKDHIYLAIKQNGPYGVYGGYVECRSIKDGKMVWRHSFGVFDGGHVEIPKWISLENEDVVLYSFTKRTPFNMSDSEYMTDLILTKRVYNKITGEQLAVKRGDYDDKNIKNFRHFNFTFLDSYIFKDKDGMRCIENDYYSLDTTWNVTYKSYALDDDSRIMALDSARFNSVSYKNIFQIHPDTLLLVEFTDEGDNRMRLNYLSPTLKKYYSVLMDHQFDHYPVFSEVMMYSIEKRKFVIHNERNLLPPNRYLEVYVVGFDGTVHSKHFFTERTNANFCYLEWEDGEVVFMDFKYDRIDTTAVSTLNVFTKNEFEPRKIIKSFRSTDDRRSARPIGVFYEDEDHYLINFNERAYKVNYETNTLVLDDAAAMSHMLISKKELGLGSVSVSDEKNNDVMLYPNPAMGQIHISHTGIEVHQVTLTDISGREVLRDVGGADITSLSTAHLPSGWYVATIWSADGKRYIEKIVIH